MSPSQAADYVANIRVDPSIQEIPADEYKRLHHAAVELMSAWEYQRLDLVSQGSKATHLQFTIVEFVDTVNRFEEDLIDLLGIKNQGNRRELILSTIKSLMDGETTPDLGDDPPEDEYDLDYYSEREPEGNTVTAQKDGE